MSEAVDVEFDENQAEVKSEGLPELARSKTRLKEKFPPLMM